MNKLTDEKLDRVMTILSAKTSLDEAAVNDIASAPQLWWGVQRNIAAAKANATSPWPPPKAWWRSLAFVGVPSFAVIAIVVGFFMLKNSVETPLLVGQTKIEQPLTPPIHQPISNKIESTTALALDIDDKGSRQNLRSKSFGLHTRTASSKVTTPRKSVGAARDEIKSEFIALTYSGDPESGQIVRVKVPGSMMVNLGLVESVAKPSNLVDAEIVVGDDGRTHAIRFIRQSAN